MVFTFSSNLTFDVGIHFPDLNAESRFKIWCNFLKLAGIDIKDSEDKIEGTASSNVILASDVEELSDKAFNGQCKCSGVFL